MPLSKSKQSFLTLFLLAGTVVLCLGAIEGLLRVKNNAQDVYDIEMWRYSNELKRPSANPILGHEHVPSSRAVLQQTKIRINEFGLRGGPLAALQPGHRRILFLGSSMTLGWGVEEEKILTSRLETMFTASGEKAQILNAGIGNYNTTRYVERFLTKLKSIEPTDVVVHYFLNDAEILDSGGGGFLLRNSQLAVTLWVVANRILNPSDADDLLTHYKALYESDSPGYQGMVRALMRLADYAESNGIRLYLAMTPDIHNLTNYEFGFIHEKMAALSNELGYRFIDLLPAMKGITPKDIWALPGDPHPNSLGHKIMADALYPALSKNAF